MCEPASVGSVSATVTRVQDIGTYWMVTAMVGEHVVKVRLSPDVVAPSAGATVWLQLVGPHSCYYVNEELVP